MIQRPLIARRLVASRQIKRPETIVRKKISTNRTALSTRPPIRDSDLYASAVGGPLTPQAVLQNCSNLLTPEEMKEILNYHEIYYIRPKRPKEIEAPQETDFFHFVPNDHIQYRYQQLKELGRGAFGSVIRCFDHKKKMYVAIKLVKELPKLKPQIDMEIEVLRLWKLKNLAPIHHIVKVYDVSNYRGYAMFVFEVLEIDMYHCLKNNGFAGLRSRQLKSVVRQVADAVAFVHNAGFIHCDIKLENLLWNQKMTEVKLIDFGCCCYITKTMFTYVQSRFYRAPEVILRLAYGPAIDIWSCGCLICELASGRPLFPGKNEQEQLALFVGVLGMPPQEMINACPRREKYFSETGDLLYQMGEPGKISLASIIGGSDPMLLALVNLCLKWKPEERITANQILMHPWLNLSQI